MTRFIESSSTKQIHMQYRVHYVLSTMNMYNKSVSWIQVCVCVWQHKIIYIFTHVNRIEVSNSQWYVQTVPCIRVVCNASRTNRYGVSQPCDRIRVLTNPYYSHGCRNLCTTERQQVPEFLGTHWHINKNDDNVQRLTTAAAEKRENPTTLHDFHRLRSYM